MLTPDQTEKLRDVARKAGALVRQAEERVRQGTVCDSFFFGDESACAQLTGNLTRIKRQISELTASVQTGAPENWTAKEAESFGVRCSLIASEAANLGEAGNWASWDRYAQDVLREIRESIAAGVRVTTDIVGGAAGGIAGGLLDGLGIGGIAIVAIALFVYVKARSA